MRQLITLPAAVGLLSLVSPTPLVRQGQNFVLVEESRLPADTSAPGTSTTDVDLVDVEHDGDLDLVVGNSGENGDERVFVNSPCALGPCDLRPDRSRRAPRLVQTEVSGRLHPVDHARVARRQEHRGR